MSEKSKRQLAAIMFTDIVGYTEMMHQNESAAAAVRQRHRDVFQKEHQRCKGEILQYYGDGTLSIFKSAVEAVECPIAMQQQFQTSNIVPLRIGLHLGDIVFDENDVYGDGVNLASRVETLGIPGSVLISDKVNYAVKSHTTIKSQSLGHFEFKNIKDPVEVFAISNDGIKIPNRAELKGKLKENKKSIAVLPFVNMSSDPENEYFSDGIAEEILNALVKVEGLQVIARTSSFSFKGKNMDVREIGRQLNVVHILEGSVRKTGNRVRITAQLVSALDGTHFFSETYDRTLEDIFAVQDEIASKITNRLREHLGESQHEEKLVEAPTLNMEAYELYLKGLFFYNQWGYAMGKAIPYFQEAIELQNDFALPHARLGVCYYFQGFGGNMTFQEAYVKAKVHIKKTIELESVAPESYFAQFLLHVFINWDWKSAAELLKKALKLYPNYSGFYHGLSTLYWIKGEQEGIFRTHKKGLELDPLSIEMNLYMGAACFLFKDYEQAILYFDKVLEMVPKHRVSNEYKGWVAAYQEKYEEAIAIFEKLEPIGYRMHRSTCLGWVYFKMGEKEKATVCLEEVKKLESSPRGLTYTVDLTTLYTCFGNFDMAFYYLEKAIKNRIGSIMMVKAYPQMIPLQADPRFKKIEALIGEVPPIEL